MKLASFGGIEKRVSHEALGAVHVDLPGGTGHGFQA